MKELKSKRVLITGGASGIGKLMGMIVLEKGADLIIWDINRENLEQARIELDGKGKVTVYEVDISNPEQVKSTASLVIAEHGGVDVLINNAGVVVGKYFHKHTFNDIKKTMDVNSNAPMYITQEFLPGMLDRNTGHICNIASSAGLISNPKMSVYAASKWAVIGWSDSLRLEMQQLKKNISVTTVTPYYINTGMFSGVRSVVPILKADKVAHKIIRAIERDRIFLSMPWSVRFVRFGQGLLPVWLFDLVVGKLLGVYKTMEHFVGRK